MLGHVVVAATVAGRPAHLVLDPIDGVMIDTRWASTMGIALVDGAQAGYGRRTFIGGAGAERREVLFAPDLEVAVGTVSHRATRPAIPFDSLLSESIGHEVDGLIGLSAFGDAIVHFSPGSKRLVVHGREDFVVPADASPVPVRYDAGRRPIVSMEFEDPAGDRVPVSAYLDLGMSGNFRFTTRFANRTALLSAICRAAVPAVPDRSEVGLGGALESVRARLPRVWLAGTLVDSGVTSTIARELEGADAAPEWDVLVGWGLLRNYDWWFDLTGARLWSRRRHGALSHGSAEGGVTFRLVRARPDEPLVVAGLDDAGGARGAGLLAGDVIEQVDGRRVEAGDAEDVRILLSRSGDRSVPVVIRRNGVRRVLAIRPKETLVDASACATRDSTMTIPNRDSRLSIEGTLTRPAGPVRAIAVLASVAGPDARDMTIGRHRLFGKLAEDLAQTQIATFRFDDRGVGGSTGRWIDSGLEDRARDLCDVVRALRVAHQDVPIGVLGLSEGGGVALLADWECGPLAFVGLLSTPLRPGGTEMRAGVERVLAASPVPAATQDAFRATVSTLIRYLESVDPTVYRDSVASILSGPFGQLVVPAYRFVPTDTPGKIDFVLSPWYLSQVRYDVAPRLETTTSPVFGIYGSLDQVIAADSSSRVLVGSRGPDWVAQLSGHNHLLQRARTGSPAEYATLDGGISPTVVATISRYLDLALQPAPRRQRP